MENAGVEAEIYSQLKGKWLSFQSNHRDSVGHAAAFVHLSTCRSLYQQVTFSDYYVRLATAFDTHLLALYSLFRRLPLLLKLRGGFKGAARPLQLCNTAATPLRRDSKPRKQRCSSGVWLHAEFLSQPLYSSQISTRPSLSGCSPVPTLALPHLLSFQSNHNDPPPHHPPPWPCPGSSLLFIPDHHLAFSTPLLQHQARVHQNLLPHHQDLRLFITTTSV
ncbi:uncharacterized protein LOC122989855 isoform X3 [Thunnus albacares]|uniref:uncharacterized protein LOC122989855 isoform X3 n=1 Tax=Thunnus albacares TaxID=8236 RepID=UPI001CF63A7D|nr:uncharacterized protein LOC122989855 isoform X3 [Thunnus albacares]